MYCEKCNCVISDSMNFCPFCGHLVSGEEKRNYFEKENIELLYQEESYDKILEIAIQGNIIAKFYYVRHVISVAQKKFQYDNNLTKRLSQESESGSMFCTAALGIYLFYHGRNANGNIDASVKVGQGLIKLSSENNEPVAMAVMAEWLFSGERISKDQFAAYQMMKEAAQQGYPPAMYKLGLWHCLGTGGISRNEEMGHSLIERAAFFGEPLAIEELKKEYDDGWFETELKFAIPDKDLGEISELILSRNKEEEFIERAGWEMEYDQCRGIKDFLSLSKRLCKYKDSDNNAVAISKWIESFLSIVLNLPITQDNIEDALKIKADTEKALQLIEKYTCPQDFLGFRENIEALQLKFDTKTMEWLMERASVVLRSKCKMQISGYLNYIKIKEKFERNIDLRTATIGYYIFILTCSMILGTFFLFGGIAFFAIFTISDLERRKERANNIKMARLYQGDYLLISSLIDYGYGLVNSR